MWIWGSASRSVMNCRRCSQLAGVIAPVALQYPHRRATGQDIRGFPANDERLCRVAAIDLELPWSCGQRRVQLLGGGIGALTRRIDAHAVRGEEPQGIRRSDTHPHLGEQGQRGLMDGLRVK